MPNYPLYKKKIYTLICAPHIKKTSSPTKILKERIERLVNLAPYNTIRMKLILDKAIDEINSIMADEIKNLDDIEMKIMVQEGKIRLERIKYSLAEFEMNALEIKKNNEIEI